MSISPVTECPTTMAGRYTRHGTFAVSRTIRSASYFVRWYGDVSGWPSSNMSSVNTPSWSPATATEETWWRQPTPSRLATVTTASVPPTFTASLTASSVVMS